MHSGPLDRHFLAWINFSSLGSTFPRLDRLFLPWIDYSSLGSTFPPLDRLFLPWIEDRILPRLKPLEAWITTPSLTREVQEEGKKAALLPANRGA